jgi:hypothetical protein
MSDSEIVISAGSTTFAGTDAVSLFRAKQIKVALRAAKRGLLMTRGATKTKLMEAVSGYTEKKYKRGQIDLAIADITEWILAMECAIPIRNELAPSV